MLPTAIIPAKNVPYRPRVYTDSFLGVELSNKLSEESCKGSKFTDVHSVPPWTQLTVKLEGKSFRLLISLPILTVSCCSSFLSPLFLLSFLVHDVSCYISSFKRVAPRFINREKKQKGNVLTLEAFDRCKRQNWKERDIYLLALSYSFED